MIKNDKEFRRNTGIDLALPVLKKLPPETKNQVLEPTKQLIPTMSDCTRGLVEALSSWETPNQLASLKAAISSNNKQEVVRIINDMKRQNAVELQKALNEAILSPINVYRIMFLIELGADVNAKNRYGLTPLHFAASYGEKEIADILISKGADINAKNDDGVTPLFYARSRAYMKDFLTIKGAH